MDPIPDDYVISQVWAPGMGGYSNAVIPPVAIHLLETDGSFDILPAHWQLTQTKETK